jgi:glycine dehydrogenase subunit 1
MFIPHTDQDRLDMLNVIGVEKIEDLFQDIPQSFRFPPLNIPEPLTELEVKSLLQAEASRNKKLVSFLGAGAYNHYIPSAVDSILRRSEYYTSYTPYQPEISQGTLRAIYDFQSLMIALTGMEVSNASHYDGATSIAEAVNLAYSQFRGKRTKIILSPSLHPHYRQTVQTYLSGSDITIEGEDLGVNTEPDSLIPLINSNTALVVVQYPDFFGRIFDFKNLVEAIHKAGALFCVSINPIALGLLKPPGEFDADIVTGEGQPLGIPLSFGGPYLGIFTTRMEYVRKMAGRIVGETEDIHGKRAYVLTLTAREQHIRREKATSNICTNQGLMALAAAVYLSLLGKQGLKQVAELCFHKAHYAAQQISSIHGYKLWSDQPFFNEFVVECPVSIKDLNQILLNNGILGGYDLSESYPRMEKYSLFAVTEMITKYEIDELVKLLAEVANG